MWLGGWAPRASAASHMSCPPISWGGPEGCLGEADREQRGQEGERQGPSITSIRKLQVWLINVQKRKLTPTKALRLPSTASYRPRGG